MSAHTQTDTAQTLFTLTSPAFADGASIPVKYTCDAIGGVPWSVYPPLLISGVPAGTKSFALIMHDPDVPKALMPDGEYVHWVVYNVASNMTDWSAGDVPTGKPWFSSGINTSGEQGYRNPCPPSQYEPSEHRYIFTLYALNTILPLQAGATKAQVLTAMQGHIIAQTQLIGKYRRQ